MGRIAGLSLAITILGSHAASAQSVASAPDPLQLPSGPTYTCSGGHSGGNNYECNEPFKDTNDRTVRNLTLNKAIRNLVLISAGQSNRESVLPSGYTPKNAAAIDNFNIYDGANYAYQEPLLGTSYIQTADGGGPGFIMGEVADTLISNGTFDHVVLVPAAVGATDIAAWAPGGVLQDRLCVVMKRLDQRGFVAGPNVTVAMEWGLGESDNQQGTTQAAWTASFNGMLARMQSCGFSGRTFVAVETWAGGVTSSVIQNAQRSVVNGTTVFQSANADTIGASSRQISNTHLNNAGGAALAAAIVSAMHASGAPF